MRTEDAEIELPRVAQCDVVVAGAGPAGSSLATVLARTGLDVVLLEGTRFERVRVGETLAPKVGSLLGQIDLSRSLASVVDAVPCYGTRSTWGSDEVDTRTHLTNPDGAGWHVERVGFDSWLANEAAAVGCRLHLGTRCTSVTVDGGAVTAFVQDASGHARVHARYFIDATGRGVLASRMPGARSFVADRLVGVLAYYQLEPGREEAHLLVEATSDGWWYSAPAGRRTLVVAMMTDGDLVGTLEVKTPTGFDRALDGASRTRERVGAATPVHGPLVRTAAIRRLLRTHCGDPWLAVGDAGVSVDPLSGTGVQRAIASGSSAAQAVLRRDAGAKDAFERFELERDHTFTEHLRTRAEQYEVECRYADQPFWLRRAARAVSPIGEAMANQADWLRLPAHRGLVADVTADTNDFN